MRGIQIAFTALALLTLAGCVYAYRYSYVAPTRDNLVSEEGGAAYCVKGVGVVLMHYVQVEGDQVCGQEVKTHDVRRCFPIDKIEKVIESHTVVASAFESLERLTCEAES